jgi:hypothetical protein
MHEYSGWERPADRGALDLREAGDAVNVSVRIRQASKIIQKSPG